MLEAIRSKRKLPNSKFLAAGTVVLTLFFISSILHGCAPKPPTAQTTQKPTLVNTDTLKLNTLEPSIKTIGTMSIPAITTLSSQVQGSIDEVLVENGEKVKAGQILMTLNDTEPKRIVQQAKAALVKAETALQTAENQYQAHLKLIEKDKSLRNLARKSFERYTNLQSKNLATAAQVDQANEVLQRQESSLITRQNAVDTWPASEKELQATLESAQAQFDQATSDLASTQVISPFAGRIQHINVGPSSRISVGTQLINLYEDQSLVLEASLPESFIDLVIHDDELLKNTTAVASMWGQDFHFHLNKMTQKTDLAGITVGIFKPESGFEYLALNQSMSVTIKFAMKEPHYAIPVTSVYDHSYIYLLSNENTLVRQEINMIGETFQENQRYYVITAGQINEGTTYITSQLLTDINGLKVQPVNPES